MQKISYTTTGSIWKIIPIDDTHICVEIRDKINFLAEWKIFSIDKEHCIYSYTTEQNSWWYNIADAQYPYFFLHELKQGKNPEINSLQIINIDTKEVIEHNKLQLETIEPSKIIASNKVGTRETIPLPINHVTKNILSPTIYKKDNEHYQIFEELIKSYTTFGIEFECEYLETELHCIIGFYVLNINKTFDSYVIVLGKYGELKLLENNHTNLKGKSEGLFFIQNDKLIFTKNDNEIIINKL